MNKGFVIAIDGPVAAGKGTIAPDLSKRLNGFYLYTGATYRSLALYCLENTIDVHDAKAVIAALDAVLIDLLDSQVFLNGKEVTEDIKRVDVARAVPKVAAIPEVRHRLVARQQEIAARGIDEGKIIVIEGRDTATVVFPDAALKVFLTADAEVRAKRRLSQLHGSGNAKISLATVLADLEQRDKEDIERVTDPLVDDPEKHGYFLVDNSYLSEPDTVGIIIDELKRRKLV
jgi:cytidylate kinase